MRWQQPTFYSEMMDVNNIPPTKKEKNLTIKHHDDLADMIEMGVYRQENYYKHLNKIAKFTIFIKDFDRKLHKHFKLLQIAGLPDYVSIQEFCRNPLSAKYVNVWQYLKTRSTYRPNLNRKLILAMKAWEYSNE